MATRERRNPAVGEWRRIYERTDSRNNGMANPLDVVTKRLAAKLCKWRRPCQSSTPLPSESGKRSKATSR